MNRTDDIVFMIHCSLSLFVAASKSFCSMLETVHYETRDVSGSRDESDLKPHVSSSQVARL